MYSRGVSEEVTGRWLREFARRDEVVIATKVFFPMADAPNRRGLSRKHITQSCEASLRRLGVEAIDLYQIHRFDPETPIDETLRALDDLVRAGKVRYLGASSGYAWQLARALYRADAGGLARFVSMQNHYNLLYREEEREVIPLCEAEGLGLVPWSPLARGLLARAQTLAEDASTPRAEEDAITRRLYGHPADADVLAALRRVAEARGAPPAQVALAWLLSKPAVAAPIVGITRLRHFDDALAALDLTLTEDEVEALEAPYAPHAIQGHA